jgi:hypothetical protein
MSCSIDRFTTTKFILKDDAAVNYIKSLVHLMQDENNLFNGYQANNFSAELTQCGERTFKFIADGFADSGPELRHSSVYNSETTDAEYSDDNESPVFLFCEIQKNLAEGVWFFVENHTSEKSLLSSSVSLYHQDGRVEGTSSYESKKSILTKLKLGGDTSNVA